MFVGEVTDACLDLLNPDRLARLDADGHQLAGDRASKTITLHRRIYAATAASGRPAGSVIHTHNTALVACSLKAFEANGSLDGEVTFAVSGNSPNCPSRTCPARKL